MGCEDKILCGVSDYLEKRFEEIAQRIYDNNNLNGERVPVGAVLGFMKFQAPEGYLVMDGSVYNITDYQNLAEYFQDNLGKINYFGGDGITNFAVPDASGEFIRGYDYTNLRDKDSARGIGKHQDATEHAYLYNHSNGNFNGTESGSVPRYIDKGIVGGKKINYVISQQHTGENDYIKYYSSRPTNINVLYCIKY